MGDRSSRSVVNDLTVRSHSPRSTRFRFPLSDADQVVIRAFKLRYDIPTELRAMFEARGSDMSQRNADGSWTLPISATYVADREGRIILAHADPDWRVRLDPDEIVKTLAALGR